MFTYSIIQLHWCFWVQGWDLYILLVHASVQQNSSIIFFFKPTSVQSHFSKVFVKLVIARWGVVLDLQAKLSSASHDNFKFWGQFLYDFSAGASFFYTDLISHVCYFECLGQWFNPLLLLRINILDVFLYLGYLRISLLDLHFECIYYRGFIR